MRRVTTLLFFLFFIAHCATAQQEVELNSGWKCTRATDINKSGEEISTPVTDVAGWLPATIPGTVLTTLLNNKLFLDPFFGMNNKLIPDIYTTGAAYYTFWFVNDFNHAPAANGDEVMLQFRGINYSYDVFLNGHKVNDVRDTGMFLRSSYSITRYLNPTGKNRLAVIVYPPSPVGNPNGGQGGDGVIAHSVTNQYPAGWDWIQPIADRNTGIWDKVTIKRTKQVHIENTHVGTLVPGKRNVEGKQKPATIKVTTEAENTCDSEIRGTAIYELGGKKVKVSVTLQPHSVETIEFPDLELEDPRLWWPNGYGPQNLYPCKISFLINSKTLSDKEELNIGVRQIKTAWNNKTNSREIRVNGQKIFIKGGNWILSDALLRFDDERYDHEVHFHKDMNLNLIRVWGGGITERPAFYDACDKYGLLVMQDFWASGDCNGRWYDPLKLEDTNARRNYPDNHKLFIESVEDQVKMLRNHASLALWCGGNEIRPPADILSAMRDSILPTLDGTRYFFEFSNDDSMSLHGGDGPYVLQSKDYFWAHKSFPFNSEIGSIGIGDVESLKRFLPDSNLVVPYYDTSMRKWIVDSVWRYHRYEGYDSAIEVYGHPKTIEDFARRAQLVNYDQYRALMEGATARMWDWYTGIIIWKTQNPWTAMKGQMYDYYVDPNACLYGTRTGSKQLHVMYDHINKLVLVANNHFTPTEKMELIAKAYTAAGDEIPLTSKYVQVAASSCKQQYKFGKEIDSLAKQEGIFLYLSLTDSATNVPVDDNLYWLTDAKGNYPLLQKMPLAKLNASARQTDKGIEVTIANPLGNPVAFFQRLTLIHASGERVLPAFYSDNYVSVLPGQEKTYILQVNSTIKEALQLYVEGWNTRRQFIEIK
ncbi:glycosyl hydrolase [Flavipsychrobacter stenotrophus]|uniref:Glycosyl hydrolase n=1 Tax=Flavipsychrobacter stenotrophus TaxID=2077091 RepID=A0A2S7SUQ8_9BACT|nr:glycoside hydrolase family 2 TIM barrel-domain containing protein [Flavipsychrobacter stenotrophus]PQJ10650.1 glycosyl hydrolase [Flavipsychrobacter stenotrophus]